MEVDWDLHAVVRGCSSTSTTATATSSRADFCPLRMEQSAPSVTYTARNSIESRSVVEELQELYMPFFPKSQPPPLIKPGPVCKHPLQPKGTTSRSKRRKNVMKKVCQVPAEGISSDVWSWRKYGQKPIKGSPYPRGYYRCSSSKGCLARKQVERNRSNPNMFIVTYTAEHNHPVPRHRSSLAGSTRQKPLTVQSTAVKSSATPASSMEEEPTNRNLGIENIVDGEDLLDNDEDEFSTSEVAVSDDFFEGLEELAGQVTGDCFSDHIPANFSLPWLPGKAATAAGNG